MKNKMHDLNNHLFAQLAAKRLRGAKEAEKKNRG